MKHKGILALFAAAAIGVGAFALNTHTPTSYFFVPGSGASVLTAEAAASPSASAVARAVKKAYSGGYIPDYKLSKDEIKTRYGVDSSLYSSAYAQVPMISARVDEIVIFKAKNSDSKKKILAAVKQYQKKLKDDRMQYPSNLLKIQGSKVYKKGRYICFFMMGDVSKSIEESGTEAEIIKEYQNQNKKAVNAVKKAIK